MFWQRFYDLCNGIGSKPNPVGKRLGIASGSISAWKTGTIPDRDALVKIADFFECSVDYLLGRTDNPQAHKSNSVVFGDLSNNSGIVGNVGSTINSDPIDSEIMELAQLIKSLPIVKRAQAILAIEEIKNK